MTYSASLGIFLPLFLVWEFVLAYPTVFWINVEKLSSFAIVGRSLNCYMVQQHYQCSPQQFSEPLRLFWHPLYGIRWLFDIPLSENVSPVFMHLGVGWSWHTGRDLSVMGQNEDTDGRWTYRIRSERFEWMDQFRWYDVEVTWWRSLTFLLCFVIPCVGFVYFVYEPAWSQKLRAKVWAFLSSRVRLSWSSGRSVGSGGSGLAAGASRGRPWWLYLSVFLGLLPIIYAFVFVVLTFAVAGNQPTFECTNNLISPDQFQRNQVMPGDIDVTCLPKPNGIANVYEAVAEAVFWEPELIERVVKVSFSDCYLSELPESWTSLARFPRLSKLEMQRNFLRNISRMQNMTQWQHFYLSENRLRDDMIPVIASLSNVYNLQLHFNYLVNVGGLAAMPQLENAVLNFNDITDEGMFDVGGVRNELDPDIRIGDRRPKLKVLGLTDNNIAGSNFMTRSENTLQAMCELERLAICDNPLTSDYPVGISFYSPNDCDIGGVNSARLAARQLFGTDEGRRIYFELTDPDLFTMRPVDASYGDPIEVMVSIRTGRLIIDGFDTYLIRGEDGNSTSNFSVPIDDSYYNPYLMFAVSKTNCSLPINAASGVCQPGDTFLALFYDSLMRHLRPEEVAKDLSELSHIAIFSVLDWDAAAEWLERAAFDTSMLVEALSGESCNNSLEQEEIFATTTI